MKAIVQTRYGQADGFQLKETKKTKPEANEILILAVNGKMKPVIDRCYPLSGVADVHRYVESGHKTGKLVISVV